MKKIVLVLIAFLATTSLMWSQDITLTDEEVQKLLCKSWQMGYTIANGEIAEQKNGTPNIAFNFRKDHTFDFIENGSKTAVGEWRLIPEKKWVALAIQRKVSLLITSINEKEFVAISTNQISSPGKEKREVVFKVK
ncbi:MAG: hypothetical protein Aureis2KO_10570 [Aureisphaera sp.]